MQIPVGALTKLEVWLREPIRDEINQALQSKFSAMPNEQVRPVAAANHVMGVSEAAAFMGISLGMVRRLVRENKLAFYRVGRRLLISKANHIDPFLNASGFRAETEYTRTKHS